jgi:hypothetical protein
MAMLTLVGCGSSGSGGYQFQNPIKQEPPPPRSVGPLSLNIGTSYGDYTISSINPGDRVEFNFTVAGADVTYSVYDPDNNIILKSSQKGQSGGGSFIAATSGRYLLRFSSAGIITPSVITVSYTVYYAH